MSKISVSNTTELQAALKSARSGDTILLKSGSYGAVSLQNSKFDKAVTITSADADAPAELTGLTLRNVAGVNLSNLQMTDKSPLTSYDFMINGSSRIGFDQVTIKGGKVDGSYAGAPIMIRNSSDVTITNSEVKEARYGISLLDNTGITIKNSYFHDLRTDGIRGGGNSQVTISDNYFTNFAPKAGDHADAIQFWTTNETKSATDITITNNAVVRGSGSPIQGIFMNDETKKLPYKNVVIDGNIVVGGVYHGINVANAVGLTVTNNTVTGTADQKSWIRVPDGTAISGNSAQNYIVGGVNRAAVAANKVILATVDGGASLLKNWMKAHGVPENLKAAATLTTLIAGSAAGALDGLVKVAGKGLPASETALIPMSVILGTDGGDTLKAAKAGDSTLKGLAGNDIFTGGPGTTYMEGGAGDDIYNVNSIRDIVVETANGGNDTVYTKIDYRLAEHVETLRLAATGLTVHGNALDNRIVGTAGADIVYGGDGADTIQALAGDDTLYGEGGDDALNGGEGNDKLFGGDGDDKLIGEAGDDVLDGGAGNDVLEGGAGADLLTGGAGADVFLFREADRGWVDTILDFSSAQGDRINVSAIDAIAGGARNEAFTFIGAAAFTKVAGQLHYRNVEGGVLVEGDVDGDGRADLAFVVKGVTSLALTDFVL